MRNKPIEISRRLASIIGLNQAVVLSRIADEIMEMQESGAGAAFYFHDGDWWIRRSQADWAKEFPWWSPHTVGRIFKKLRKQALIKTSDQYNEEKSDRTTWLTVDWYRLGFALKKGVAYELGD